MSIFLHGLFSKHSMNVTDDCCLLLLIKCVMSLLSQHLLSHCHKTLIFEHKMLDVFHEYTLKVLLRNHSDSVVETWRTFSTCCMLDFDTIECYKTIFLNFNWIDRSYHCSVQNKSHIKWKRSKNNWRPLIKYSSQSLSIIYITSIDLLTKWKRKKTHWNTGFFCSLSLSVSSPWSAARSMSSPAFVTAALHCWISLHGDGSGDSAAVLSSP